MLLHLQIDRGLGIGVLLCATKVGCVWQIVSLGLLAQSLQLESLESSSLMNSYALFQPVFRFVYQNYWLLRVGLMSTVFHDFFDFHVFT